MSTLTIEPKIGLEITAEEIVTFHKSELQIQTIYKTILCQRIIHQAAQRRELTVTPAEVQDYADQIRREQRLEKAEDTLKWLTQQMVTPDDWEAGIVNQLLAKKLAASLFESEVETFFAQNKLNFDQVVLYQIIVSDQTLAWEIFHQIKEEEINFHLAAKLHDIEEQRRHQCGYEGKLFRWKIAPKFAPVIFAADIHTVTTPLPSEQGSHIFMVEEFIPAQLTPEIKDDIIQTMFDEWLIAEYTYLATSIEQ